jgi:hypothetical protein
MYMYLGILTHDGLECKAAPCLYAHACRYVLILMYVESKHSLVKARLADGGWGNGYPGDKAVNDAK